MTLEDSTQCTWLSATGHIPKRNQNCLFLAEVQSHWTPVEGPVHCQGHGREGRSCGNTPSGRRVPTRAAPAWLLQTNAQGT